MTAAYAIFNGQLIPAANAALPAGDLAIGRGYAVFDFFRTLNGRPVFLDDHLDRLERSCREMRLPLASATLRRQLFELMERNAIPDSGVRITVTGGCAADGYSVAEPNILVTQQPLSFVAEQKPIHLATFEHQRQLPHVKSIDYLMAVWLRPWIAERGADEVLYHTAGRITECPRSNLFLVTHEGTLVTPARHVLSGITRRHVLELAKPHMETVERDVTFGELAKAREIFITSTSKGFVPVARIDGRRVGDGEPGRTTRLLSTLLGQHVAENAGAAAEGG